MTSLILRTALVAVIGLGLTWFLGRSISAERFREMRWAVMISSALFWGALTTVLVFIFWDSYYAPFKPDWLRWWNPILAAVFYGVVGLLLWALARLIRWNPAATFCLLGGLWSIPEHLLGIYRFKILDIPLLQGVSAIEILVFGFFEYIVFWALALGLAVLVRSLASASPSGMRINPG